LVLEKLVIYTDGGCLGNPGPGGWAYFILSGGEETNGSGGEGQTTNNRMELTAVIHALNAAKLNYPESVLEVHTDSQYVQKGITEWINRWIRNGWKTANKKPVKNVDLWKALKEVSDTLKITWKWVPGHAGVEYNEACDALVKQEMAQYQ
jgi:ribonuclease HI